MKLAWATPVIGAWVAVSPFVLTGATLVPIGLIGFCPLYLLRRHEPGGR